MHDIVVAGSFLAMVIVPAFVASGSAREPKKTSKR